MNCIHREGYSFRDVALKTTGRWLELQREDSGAEGLWRIHDDLYDLSEWMHSHPGGKEWLQLTKGTDITEAFEVHHISTRPEKLLPKYFVRKATKPRRSLLTFHENGFYRTLKKRVREVLETLPKNESAKSKFILDFLLLTAFATACLAVHNAFWIFISALTLTWTSVVAHNFFHQKDNWRMYTFNLTLMNYRDWRVSHALSHHLYPNTLLDIECSMAEPLLVWFPVPKGFISKYMSIIYSPLMYTTLYLTQYAVRVYTIISNFKLNASLLEEFIPYLLPLVMYVVTGVNFGTVFNVWICIVFTSSFMFGLIGLNAAHHHPRIYHHGDKLRDDLDFGIFQIDAVMDRADITGSRFLVLTHFGDHGLHHMFPTLDHGYLSHLYPIFKEVCKEFNIQLRFSTQWDMLKGQFRQLLRTECNDIPGL